MLHAMDVTDSASFISWAYNKPYKFLEYLLFNKKWKLIIV